MNPPADWWLFLLRKPLDLATFDGRCPVRLAVGQVHCGWPGAAPFRCDVGFVCQKLYRLLAERGPDFIEQIAALDRVRAARRMNRKIAVVLEKLREEGSELTVHRQPRSTMA